LLKDSKKEERLTKGAFAQGSLEECRYYLILADDLGYGSTVELNAQLEEVSKMLGSYCSSLLNSDS
jgi:four helix bundle protein